MFDTPIRQDLLGRKVIIRVHDLKRSKDVPIYTIHAVINQQGEIFNSITGERIYPLKPGVADELGKIVVYTEEQTKEIVEIVVKAVEILIAHPEYTIKIARVVANDDATTKETRDILIDMLTDPLKLANTHLLKELTAVVNELEEEIKDREEIEEDEEELEEKEDELENALKELDDTIEEIEDQRQDTENVRLPKLDEVSFISS